MQNIQGLFPKDDLVQGIKLLYSTSSARTRPSCPLFREMPCKVSLLFKQVTNTNKNRRNSLLNDSIYLLVSSMLVLYLCNVGDLGKSINRREFEVKKWKSRKIFSSLLNTLLCLVINLHDCP